jgi:hypothetical protein
MNLPKPFADFLKAVGRPMSEINPGSDEVAFPLSHVAEVIALLENHSIAILGGDLITEDETGKLRYANGSWSCTRKEGEASEEYRSRGYKAARDYLHKMAVLHPRNAYLVLVSDQ